MIARVLHVDVTPDQMDGVLSTYRQLVRPIHATAVGLRQHYVLANTETGRIAIVGVWDSPDAIAAVAATLEPARRRLWSRFGYEPPLENYDVADELRPLREGT